MAEIQFIDVVVTFVDVITLSTKVRVYRPEIVPEGYVDLDAYIADEGVKAAKRAQKAFYRNRAACKLVSRQEVSVEVHSPVAEVGEDA